MREDSAVGIWADEWSRGGRSVGGRRLVARLPRGEKLGASLYELPPGTTGGLYHFHHGAEELLVVLRGRPTLRTPEGERLLEEGDVVAFRVGRRAHQV